MEKTRQVQLNHVGTDPSEGRRIGQTDLTTSSNRTFNYGNLHVEGHTKGHTGVMV